MSLLYNKVKNKLEEYECSIITTLDEYNTILNIKKKDNTRIKFKAICGHISEAAICNIIYRKTGIICKDCKNKNIKSILHNKNKDSSYIESIGINYIITQLQQLGIKRTYEGCLADLFIPINDISCIGIQLKVTNTISKYNTYVFRNIKEYTNMLIICYSIIDNKTWVIPFNEITTKTSITISQNSKYNKYLTNNLYNTISTQLNIYQTLNINNICKPNNIYQYRETLYNDKRKEYLSFLNFIDNNIQNTSTDFYINNYKIQEKVLGYNKTRNCFMCMLSCNNGIINKKRQYRTYKKGENDYYWLHSSIDDRFWIIPENILYELKYISDSNKISNRKIIRFPINKYNKNMKWLYNYEYNYKNINKDTINALFNQ